MVLRRLLVVVAAAHAAATYVSPQFTGFSKAYTCAEAKEHDEIIFDCGGEFISKVSFASYGTPSGHCGEENSADFRSTKACHAMKSEIVLEERCLGQTTCMFVINDDLFGGDPCFGKQKRLAARLACGDHVAAELAAKAAKNKKKQLGYGARFLIMLVVLFSLYCGLGIVYRIRRLGVKPGPEAIPHLEMWKDLPFLVKDGIVFSIDTIKSKARPNYQTVL
jgi:hypothetical protein